MKVRKLIEQIERRAQHKLTRNVVEDHYRILLLLSETLNDLSSEEEFDFLKVSLEPLIQTEPDGRSYALPENFPENFIRYHSPDTGEVAHACKLDDGSSSGSLTYEKPEVFYRRDLSGETSSRPSAYTIVTEPDGSRSLIVSPPADTTDYEIQGTYIPNDWALTEDDDLPVIPNNYALLRYGVLKELEPENQLHELHYREARSYLYYRQALSSPGSFSPEADLGDLDARY